MNESMNETVHRKNKEILPAMNKSMNESIDRTINIKIEILRAMNERMNESIYKNK